MESILGKLVQPDSRLIAEGTKELRAAFKNPDAIPEMCRILSSCPDVTIRQYSALLLRKKFAKSKNWNEKLSPEARETIKKGCLQVAFFYLFNLI